MAKFIVTLLFAALLFSTASATDYQNITLVVQFDGNSNLYKEWQNQNRQGSLPALESLLGTHTTASYLLPATLQSVRRAEARNNPLNKLPARTPSTLECTALIQLLHPGNAQNILQQLRSFDGVLQADIQPEYKLLAVPNDPRISEQYVHQVVKSFEAWEKIPTNTPPVVVAIVDTGIDTAHVDLRSSIWNNPGETGVDSRGVDKRFNFVDDDNNGFIDDYFGWDYASSSSTAGDNIPLPGNPHGTHVGGIAGAIANNSAGGCGVATNIRLMPVKTGRDPASSRTVERTSDAILYAASNGARIINCSFGSPSPSFADIETVTKAVELGALIVAAAGNDGINQSFYPAAFPNVLSVAASTNTDSKAFFSNVHQTVDVSAPGDQILSTIPNNQYDVYDGTSMAAPVVSAIAAMALMRNPSFTPAQLLAHLRGSTDNIDANTLGTEGLLGMGRINALSAVDSLPLHVQLKEYQISDLDGDNLFLANNTLTMRLSVRNELNTATNVYMKLRSVTPSFEPVILNDSVFVGTINSQNSTDIISGIEVQIPSAVPFDAQLRVLVEFYVGTKRIGRDLITTTVNPSYRTLNANNITVSVNSTGNIGFNNYPENSQGVGFKVGNSVNLLFEGALIIGTSANNIPNNARGGNTANKDTSFKALGAVQIRTDSVLSGIRSVSQFDDSNEASNLNILVTETIFQRTEDSLQNVLFLDYAIYNKNSTPLQDVYVGLFHDWDIGPQGAENGAAWDDAHGYMLVENARLPELPHIGISMVSDYTVNAFALDNPGDLSTGSPRIYDSFTRQEKYDVISSGIAREFSNITDVSSVVSAGPITIPMLDTVHVVFIIGAGTSLSTLRATMNTARSAAISSGMYATTYSKAPADNTIVSVSNTPIQSNTATVVRYQLRKPTPTELDIVDIFGRAITDKVTTTRSLPGIFEIPISFPAVSSGVYFVRLKTAAGTSIYPIQAIR